MHPIRKKIRRTHWLPVAALVALPLLAACERAPRVEPEATSTEVLTAPSCGSAGHLSTQLYGSIARVINWGTGDFQCESMLRPDGQGIRLRFTGNAADSELAIILAMPELQRGVADEESPTVVTLTVEGSGRFFSTPTLGSCWTDIASQNPLGDSGERYEMSGKLYCVAPLGEINGDAAISIPELDFRGIVDWRAK